MKVGKAFISALCSAMLLQPAYAQLSDADATIDRKAEAALLFSGKLDTRGIHTHVSNGHVQLDGLVDSYADRLLAEDIVAQLDGVRSINNQLSVRNNFDDKFPLLSVRSTLRL